MARWATLVVFVMLLSPACSGEPLDDTPEPAVRPAQHGSFGSWTWSIDSSGDTETVGLEVVGRNQSSVLPDVTLGFICYVDSQEIGVAVDWGLQIEVAYHQRAVVNLNGELVWDWDDPLNMESPSSPNSNLTFVGDAHAKQLIEKLRASGDEIASLLILMDRYPLEDRPSDEIGADWLLEGTSTAIETWDALCSNN